MTTHPSRSWGRLLALVLAFAVALTTCLRATPALAAAGTMKTTAQGLRLHLGLINNAAPVDLGLPAVQRSWTTGGSTDSTTTLPVSLVPVVAPGLLDVGAISASAGPVTGGGGRAEAKVAGLTLLGASTLSVGAVSSSCQMTAADITTTVDVANLKVGGSQVLNPDVNLGANVPGLAGVTLDHRIVDYNATTGKLDYTIRALDVSLLSALSVIASGTVVVAESTCSGILKLGAISTDSVPLVPGTGATPTVKVTNTGDVATPNTVIKIPAPPAGYTVGTPTVTGGGTCTKSTTFITCSGVTIPGGGSVQVALPVSLSASAGAADDWVATTGKITAVSTPIDKVADTQIAISGAGALAVAKPAVSTGGSITVTPMTVAAGKSNTTAVTVANQGPSDAKTMVTIPIGAKPAGVSVVSASAAGTPCTVTSTEITCFNVDVPAGGSAKVDVKAAATTTTAPATTWDLANISATINGRALAGQGRLLTVSDPDVNLDNGVGIVPATATPGGGSVTPTVRVANIGVIPAPATTITLPAPPAGYILGTVSTTGGGTCATAASLITCTGVTVPALGAVTVALPVTLGPAVTAAWTGTVTAAAADSTGTAAGPIVTATPRFTLGVTADGPSAGTVSPGQTTTMTVGVYDQGPSNARSAPFVVVAPAGTTFGTLAGPAATLCDPLSPTAVRCTVDLTTTDPAIALALPLAVSAQADPAAPVTGGCVSLDNDTSCSGPRDRALPDIELRTPLASRLTATVAPATIVPGTSGSGLIRLTSTRAESGLTVTVPLAGLPTGFTVTSATVPGAQCVIGSAAITCTGLELTAATRKDITVGMAVASGVVPPKTWTTTGIVIAAGGEQVTVGGPLAGTGTVGYALSASVLAPPDGTVEPGDTTSLRITTANAGPSDATAAVFTVSAPAGTTFGPLTAPASTLCAGTTTRVTCTVTLAAGASTPALTLPLTVATNADVTRPVAGGCVDLDGITGCGPGDSVVPPFQLAVPFAQQVTIAATPVDVVPGAQGVATLKIGAKYGDLTGLAVTVPLADLPAGMSLAAIDAPGSAVCTRNATRALCSGLAVADGTTATLRLTVAADPDASTGTWTAAGITVAGTSTVTADQTLARIGTAGYTLSATVAPPTGSLVPGGLSSLAVTVDNLGPSDATGARVGIVAPAGTTLEAPSGATATACTLTDPTHASCTFNLTAAAAPVTFTFPLRVDPTAISGGALGGGCVDLDGSGCAGPGDQPIAPITVATPLDGRLSVTSAPAQIVPGGAADGTLSFTSTRNETGLVVTVPVAALPTGFTVVSASIPGGSCTVTAGIVCTGVDLIAGQAAVLTTRVGLASSATAPRTWTATGVTVAGSGETATLNQVIAKSLAPQAAVTTVVTGPAAGTVSAGGTATVTVVATNAGPSDAPAATFTVRAPAGTTFGPLTGDAAGICTPATTTLTICTTSLAKGAATPTLSFAVAVPANADPFTPLGGGCVDADDTAGCGSGDSVLTPIVLRIPFDRRVAIITAAAAVTPGGTGTATAAVTAASALTGMTVTVPLADLPAGVTVTAATVTGGTCAIAAAVTCAGLNFTAGQTRTVSLAVAATAGTAPATAWTVTGLAVGDADDQLSVNRRLALTGPAVYTLVPTVAAPAAVEPGGTTSMGVTVRNSGPSDAADARIGFVAPAGTTFGTLVAPAATSCTTASPTRVTCEFDLAAGASAGPLALPLTVDATVSPGTPLSGGCVDLDDDGHCAGDTALPAVPLVTPFHQQVTVSTVPAVVAAGGSGTAQVVIDSTPAQTGLSVAIPLLGLPGAVTFDPATVSTTGACTADATAISCTGVSVPASGRATVTVPVHVAGGAAPDTVFTATTITVTGPSSATAVGGGVLVRATAADYVLTATVAGPPAGAVLPGGGTTMTVTLDNTGTGPAVDAPITVHAPAGTTFGPLTSPVSDACTVATPTTLRCQVTLTPADAPLVWVLPLVVAPTTPAGTPLSGGCIDLDGDGRCGGAGDATVTPIVLRVPLSGVVTTAATPAPITPGGAGTATFTVATTADRTQVTIAVPTTGLPAGLSVTGVSVAGVACPIAAGVATCAGIDIPAGAPVTVTVAVDAAAAAVPGLGWTPAVTVAQGTDTTVRHPRIATVGPAVHALDVSVAVPAADTLLPGGTGELTVTMTNAGPSVLRGARASFQAPAGTTFTAPAGAAADHCTLISPTLVTCTADLAVGSLTFALGITVAPTASTSVDLTGGCVDLDGDGVCGPLEPVIPPLNLGRPLSGQAQLGTDPAVVVPGGTATGQVVVDADRRLTGLTVTVPLTALPTGLTAIGASGPVGSTCALTSAEITCTAVTAEAGTGPLIAVTVRAGAALPAGVTWTPGPIVLTGAGGATSTASGVLARTGVPSAGVTYALSTVAGTIPPGGSTVLTATATNTGPSDAHGVPARFIAPIGTTFGALTGQALADCAPAGPTRVDCRVTLTAGARTQWPLTVQIPAAAAPNAYLSGGCVDVDLNGACGGGDQPLPAVHVTATLAQALTITAGNTWIAPGGTESVTINVAATRAGNDLTVSIPTDDLPDSMRVTAATVDGGSCSMTSALVTCTGVRIAAGGRAVVRLSTLVHPAAAPGVTWEPEVAVTEDATTVVRTLTAVTVAAADTDLAFAVTVPGPRTLKPGDPGELTVTVTNTGTSDAVDATYDVRAPTGITFRPLTGAAATMCTLTTTVRLRCQIDVDGNARVQFSLPIQVSATASTATALSGGCIDAGLDNSCTAPPDFLIPAITLASLLSGNIQLTGAPAMITPGRTGTGVLRVTALTAVTGADVTVPLGGLPAGLTVTGAAGPVGSTCALGVTEIRCTGVNLTAGANNAVSIVVRAAASTAPAVVWRAADITVAAGSESATGPAALATTGPEVAPIAWRIDGFGATVAPGATETITITGTSGGPSDVERRVATVKAPENTVFGALSGRALTDCSRTSTTLLTCTFDVMSGGQVQWVVPVVVAAAAADGDLLSGACVTAAEGTACGDEVEVDTGAGLAANGTLTVTTTTITTGDTGTAVVRLAATTAYQNLTLTVPLTALPGGFTLGEATLDGAVCTVGPAAVTCTGVTLVAGQARELRLAVTVGAAVRSGTAWPVTGVVLTDGTARLTAAGTLVTTAADSAGAAISVSVGDYSVASPAPGQTTVLPVTLTNTGTIDATGRTVRFALPAGTTHGLLPGGCAEGLSNRVVVCTVTLPAGGSTTLRIPLVVDAGADPGDTLTGGCVDGVLAIGSDVTYGDCGDDDDVPLPGLTVGKPMVDLSISYAGPAVTAGPSDGLLIKLPYGNTGTHTAADVNFTVELPDGVTLSKAAVLVDSSTVDAAAFATAAASEADTVAVACTTGTTVVCQGPDQADGVGSELWLTLAVADDVVPGTYPLRVTIATTSAEGDVTDNTVEVPLTLTAASSGGDTPGDGDDGDDGDDNDDGVSLPTTGPGIAGALLLSMALILAGVAMLTVTRRQRPADITPLRDRQDSTE